MTEHEELQQLFEEQFFEFERDRMCPLDFLRSVPVKKPTYKHMIALIHCTHLLENGLHSVIEKRFKKGLETDLEAIAEIRTMLYEIIENPTLPFVEPVPAGDFSEPFLKSDS